MSGRNSTEAARDAEAPAVQRLHPTAPLAEKATVSRRRDPFAHGELPQRPNYLPEEAETVGDRSEIWATLKGLALAAAAIIFLGWLLTAG
ncbi:hypothetical protein [Falsiroseomonas sp.]|uniref:hypothetical protein n=1 Tax=Falsiroseomonas sp. TaxID=2870721 RepID=UPI0027329BD3|nr:hypothetical protein [Falsiroseomonas sp.]MDP3414654.1 hypothetical protein [Falsiroseomonas sp.]